MPRTSPRRTSRSSGASSAPPTPRTDSRASSSADRFDAGVRRRRGDELPAEHQLDEAVVGELAGRDRGDVAAVAQDRHAVAPARTSSRWWEMKRMPCPLAATRRSAAKRRSTSGPGSDAVGSSSTSSGKRPSSRRRRAPGRRRRPCAPTRRGRPSSASGRCRSRGRSSAARRARRARRRGELHQRPAAALEAEVVGDRHRLDEAEVLVDEAQPGVARRPPSRGRTGRRRPRRRRPGRARGSRRGS